MGDDTNWEDYDSGPFCRHWSDPSWCEEKCQTCKHGCTDHEVGYDKSCMTFGCDCKEWKEMNEYTVSQNDRA